MAEMADRCEKRDELLLAALKEIAAGVNALAGALAANIPFDPLAKDAAPAASAPVTARETAKPAAPATVPPVPPVTSVADAPVAKAPEAQVVAPAQPAPTAAPAAAPATARETAPTKDDIAKLMTKVRAYLSASPDNVAKLRESIVGGKVVRVSDVHTWAEFDALSALIGG